MISNKNSFWRYLYFYELKAYQYGYVIQENSDEPFQIEKPEKMYPISFYGFLTLTHPFVRDGQQIDILSFIVSVISKQQPNFDNARYYQLVQFSFVNKQFTPIYAIKEYFRIAKIKRNIKNEERKLKKAERELEEMKNEEIRITTL